MSPPLRLAVFGDSIAYGQGATHESHTLGARLAADLRSEGIPTEVRVFAVPRARSDALTGQVRSAQRWEPQLAVVIVGANDVTHFVPPEMAAAALGSAVHRLREGGAEVIVVPAPDLSVVPWVPPQFQALVRTASAGLRAAQVRVAEREGATTADINDATTAAFAANLDLFSADRFHPSSAGYGVIATAIRTQVLAVARRLRDKRPA